MRKAWHTASMHGVVNCEWRAMRKAWHTASRRATSCEWIETRTKVNRIKPDNTLSNTQQHSFPHRFPNHSCCFCLEMHGIVARFSRLIRIQRVGDTAINTGIAVAILVRDRENSIGPGRELSPWDHRGEQVKMQSTASLLALASCTCDSAITTYTTSQLAPSHTIFHIPPSLP